MKKGVFRTIVLTRGILIALAATLVAFVVVFLGIKSVISGARLAIGQHYVMRAVADTSGSFYTDSKWEYKEMEASGVKIFKFILGVDISSPQSIAASVSANISENMPKAIPAISNAVVVIQNKATPGAPQPSNTPQSETAPTPTILEQKLQTKRYNPKNAKGISMTNETDFAVDINQLPVIPPYFKLNNNGPQVLIVHTHTTESYTASDKFKFTYSETDRTTDTRFNVARVGDELTECIKKYKINVLHDKTIHDYPEYVFSYNRAFSTISSDIARNPSIKVVIDLHRDAIFGKNGEKIKITDVINNEKVAQVMTVVGTNQLGLKHDNWRTNLKFAAMLQEQFIKISPTFARPINLRTARFNGHTAPGAIILEVGSSGNTLDEALASCKHIAKSVSGVLEQLK